MMARRKGHTYPIKKTEITSAYKPLATTQLYDHAHMQGSLGNVVFHWATVSP